jgi:tetratricopeptide (TPR) repeat protein
LSAEEQLDTLKQLGRLLYQTLEQFEDALSIFAQILEVSPHDEEVMSSLEVLLSTPEFRGPSATYLLPYYQHTQQVEREIYCLKVLAEESAAEARDSEYPEELTSAQLEYLHKAAHLYSEAGAAQEAYDTYQEALFASPSSDQTIKLMTTLVQEAEAWELLIQTYDQLIGLITDDALLAQRCEELGNLYRDRLEDLEGALASFERARAALVHEEAPGGPDLELDEEGEPLETSSHDSLPYPADRERVLDAIEPLYNQLAKWQELTDLWSERADRARDYHHAEDEVRYLHQAGVLC